MQQIVFRQRHPGHRHQSTPPRFSPSLAKLPDHGTGSGGGAAGRASIAIINKVRIGADELAQLPELRLIAWPPPAATTWI